MLLQEIAIGKEIFLLIFAIFALYTNIVHVAPGRWRLLLDLSSPEGQSVYDGIPGHPFIVQYVSVDAFIGGIVSLGRGALMAKFGMASAYRSVAVQPGGRPLLCVKWHGQCFCGFGAPFWAVFSTISLRRHCGPGWMDSGCSCGVTFLCRCLDDFLTWDPLASLCAAAPFKPVFVCVVAWPSPSS